MIELNWDEISWDAYQNGMGRDITVRLIHKPTGIVGEGYHDNSTAKARDEAEANLRARLDEHNKAEA